MTTLLDKSSQLGVGWVSVEVSWASLGAYWGTDDVRWGLHGSLNEPGGLAP